MCPVPHSADFSGRGDRKPRPCRPGRTSDQHASADPRQTLGRLGEQLATEHLARRGFQIVERNYRTRWGELDIIAFDGQTLAFCEVKTRRAGASAITPFDSLHPRKRMQVRRMARDWLSRRDRRPVASTLRFDAIGVTLDAADQLVSLEHLEGAF